LTLDNFGIIGFHFFGRIPVDSSHFSLHFDSILSPKAPKYFILNVLTRSLLILDQLAADSFEEECRTVAQNKVHRRPTSSFFLRFPYDFGVTRDSSSNADAMVLASARLRGIHPPDYIQNGGRPGGNASQTRTG
jgi:hypothetical protein